MRKIDYEMGSGNVFADIGVPNAEEALVKSKLAVLIAKIIAARGLTQREAAEAMGTSQARVSGLLRGHLNGVSEAKLHTFLNALGHDVRIIVTPRRSGHGRTTVRTAAAQDR